MNGGEWSVEWCFLCSHLTVVSLPYNPQGRREGLGRSECQEQAPTQVLLFLGVGMRWDHGDPLEPPNPL